MKIAQQLRKIGKIFLKSVHGMFYDCGQAVQKLNVKPINKIKMSKVKVQPLADRVLVEAAAAEEKTAGGIIIPDTAKEKPIEGKVLAIGSGSIDEQGSLRPLTVKEGDRVLFGKWSGTEVKIGGKDLLIMKESDIFGIIA